MFDDIRENEELVKGAYRKLKSYYYYNKNFLLMRQKIAEFENDHEQMNNLFGELAYCLCHPRSRRCKVLYDSLLNEVDFFVLPKSFDSVAVSGNKPVTNTMQRDKKLKSVNFFINAPIAVYILDTVWTVYLAKIEQDNKMLSYDVYGNTINNSALFNDNKTINFENRQLFNRYFIKYTNWRNNAFQKLEQNYDKKQDSILISLDIKSYFYSVVLDFNNLTSLFGQHELLDGIRTLTKFERRVYSTYVEQISKYRKDLPLLNKHEYILPIGLFSSMLLGNIYLSSFDKAVRKTKDILYYGRYVDDMLFVVKKTIKPEDTNQTIIDDVFVKTGLLDNKDNGYVLHNFHELVVQPEKIKVLYIDHKESRAILDIYNDTIRIIPSQMDPLPQSDQILNSFDEVAYTVENFTKEKKLRDIGLIGVDSFKVGRYFSSLIHRYSHVNINGPVRTEIDKHISQIDKFFSGSQGVEFYSNWLNYMYFLVTTQRVRQLRAFYYSMSSQVKALKHTSLDKQMYAKTTSVNKRAKDALLQHLDICLYLALSLDSNMANKHFKSQARMIETFSESNMFDHSLVAFPLSNYLQYDTSVSYIKMKISEIGEYPEKIEKSFKFIWSPRFIHYDELLLLLFYKYHKENKGQSFNYVRNGLVDKFMAVNHMKYLPFSITTEDTCRIDEYTLRTIHVTTDVNDIPQKLNIAVGSLNIDEQNCIRAYERWATITIKAKEELNSILRESFYCFSHKERGTMLLVLPELCFPVYWLAELIRFSKQAQIAVITGLQYICDDSGKIYNYVATLLPFRSGKNNYKNVFVHIREKNDYSPIEFKALAAKGLYCENRTSAEYQVFSWRGIKLSPLVCFEMTDVMARALLKGRCDIIAAPVFNPDTTYFSNIIDATARDLHSFIIQANTSSYGDSRVTGPFDRDSKDIFKIKGGDNDHVVIGTIDFKKVKDYEENYQSALENEISIIRTQKGKRQKEGSGKRKSKPDIKPLSARFHKK